MPSVRPLSCPGCDMPVLPEHTRQIPFDCPHCGARIGFSEAPLIPALLLGFALSVWVVQLLGLKAYAALLWLPILVACIVYALPIVGARIFRLTVQKPRASGSYKTTLRFFLSCWFFLILFTVVYGSIIGFLPFLFGEPMQESAEATEIFSMPLRLVNPRFMIRPDKSLAEV